MRAGRKRTAAVLSLVALLGAGGPASGSEERLSLTVDQAVSVALEENLDLRLRRSDIESARAAEMLELGTFDARLEAGAGGGGREEASLLSGEQEREQGASLDAAIMKRTTAGTELGLALEANFLDSDSGLVAIDPAYRSGVEVRVSQPLLRGRGRAYQTSGVRAAAKITAAAEQAVEQRAADLAARVKKTYWELVFARQDIEVKQLSLRLAGKLRQETSDKIASGILADVEIFQPDSVIARREEGLIAAEKRVAAVEDDLKALLNNRDWQAAVIPVDLPEVTAEAPNLEAVLAKALAGRPDIAAADLQVEAARIVESRAVDDLRPSLALVGSIGLGGLGGDYLDSLEEALSDPDWSWQVALRLEVPIGKNVPRGRLASARAELSRASSRAELLRQEVERGAREAVRDVTLAIKTIEATRRTSLAASKGLEAEQEKFRVGLATANDVLELQDRYAQALAGEKRALADLAKALAELDRTQGVVSFGSGGETASIVGGDGGRPEPK